MPSSPPPDSDRIAAISVRLAELEKNQRTWPGAVADAIGMAAVGTLGVLDKIDGVAAAVIIALVLGVRIPSSKKGGIVAIVAPFLRMFGWKLGV